MVWNKNINYVWWISALGQIGLTPFVSPLSEKHLLFT